jgi:hypothetical protein
MRLSTLWRRDGSSWLGVKGSPQVHGLTVLGIEIGFIVSGLFTTF